MGEEQWDDRIDEFHDRPVRTSVKAVSRGSIVLATVIVFVALMGAGVWAIRVATSDVKGRGDSEIIKNDARNRIRAQEGFEDKFAGIEAADKNIQITADALKARPGDVKLQTELNGQKMICNDLVGQYDAAARKFTQEEFRAADLPLKIDGTLVTTDCKENT